MKIKFVCLNLWDGGRLMPDILTFLKEQNADIVALQEVYSGTDPSFPAQYRSLEVLRQELGYPHDSFAPAVLDQVSVGKVDGGNAVLSRWPITAHQVTFFNQPYGERDMADPDRNPKTPRNLQHVQIEADGHKLQVFNLQGVWDLDGDNYSPQRRRMSELIIEAIQGKENVILAGDTNAKTTNPAMRAVEQHLTSVFGDELPSTFNMRRKTNPGYATASVDMVFVSPNIRVTQKSCPDIDISDHLPLVVTLDVPAAE
jgi:endonuclease/exonuclease/phosphatase family metal-dependent hydrolase